MRYLLGLMLTLLPVSGYAADLVPLSENGSHQNTTERWITELPSDVSIDNVCGHVGDPLFPSSINNRGLSDDPFATDSPVNHYRRDQLVEARQSR